MKRLWFISFSILALALLAVPSVQTQEGFPSDDDVNAVAKKLYCPVCPNTPLDVCETQACKDWRDEIRSQLSAGWSEEQVTAYFVERYGERVLAEPERGGFTSLVWILPVVAVLVGLAIILQVLRSWRVQRQESTAALVTGTGQVSADARARIERELQELL